jgi:hypothetical protein
VEHLLQLRLVLRPEVQQQRRKLLGEEGAKPARVAQRGVRVEAAEQLPQAKVERQVDVAHRQDRVEGARQGAPQRGERSSERLHQLVGTVGRVAGEELVGAVAGEGDLDVSAGEAREQGGREDRAVGERLGSERRKLGKEVDQGPGADLLDVVVGAERASHGGEVGGLVERRFREADRKGADPAPGHVGGGEGDERGVDPAGEKDADRYIGDELALHRAAQDRPDLRDVVAEGPIGGFFGLLRRGVSAQLDRSTGARPQQVALAQLVDAAHDAHRGWYVVELQVGLESGLVDRAGHRARPQQGAQLRREDQPRGSAGPVERLDPHRVASEEESPLGGVVEAEREHPIEARERGLAVEAVLGGDHLGVGGGAKAQAGSLRFPAQLAEVIDLTVESDAHLAVDVPHRLRSGRGEVDDGQAAMAQDAVPQYFDALAVGAAVGELQRHRRHGMSGVRTGKQHAADPAHG